MAAPQRLVQAVQAGISASAHLTALESVSAATQAVQRLGSLTARGRWRAAARDMETVESDLHVAYADAAEAVSTHAEELGIPEEALWTVGDAAGTLDLLREMALDEVENDDPRTRRILEGHVLFGATFVEDDELPDRGTTLIFGWPEPLEPASWPWQANWIVGDNEDGDGAEAQELDLFETGELEGADPILAELANELSSSRQEARAALRNAAMALTRASLLSGVAGQPEDEEDGDEEDGANGST